MNMYRKLKLKCLPHRHMKLEVLGTANRPKGQHHSTKATKKKKNKETTTTTTHILSHFKAVAGKRP